MDATADELIARLRRNPDDASAYASLRAHYERIRDHASLTNLLEGWAGRSPDHQAAARAFFEAGELALSHLGDRPRGVRSYERALERDPTHLEAALRLQAVYEEAGDQRRLVELLERRVEVMSAGGGPVLDIAALHHRLGEIWEHSWKRADKAVFHYRKAFELDPTLVPAIYAAREIYWQAGNAKAAATLCELEAKAEPDPERKVALLRELAHVRAAELADLDGAIVALKRALAVMPGDLEVMHDLADSYRQRAERNPDARVADADLRRAADVLYQVAQKVPPAEAVPHLELALDGVPDHDGALTLLERIAERVGHFELLPHRWVAFLSRAPDAPSARERRRRLAKAYLHAGQLDYAITCLEWLLEEGDAEAALNLVQLYRDHGRDDAMLRALSVAAHGLPATERIGPLRELMQLKLARRDEDAALSAAREILAIDGADSHALSYAVERLRKTEDWPLLRTILLGAAEVPQASVELRKEWLREVVFLSDRRLFDLDSAIDALRRITELDPSDRDARTQWANMLESAERWDELAERLEKETPSILDPLEKAAHYRRLAHLHRVRRGDLGLAIAALRSVRDLFPQDRNARNELCDALLLARAYDEALPMLEQRFALSTGAERVELARTLARGKDEYLGNAPETFVAWAHVLEAEPADKEALDRMEQIDEHTGNHARLLTTLMRRADLELGPERAVIYARMGRIADEKLNDLAQAAEHYGRAHECTPSDAPILDALCSVYERSDRAQELVELLGERAKLESDRDALFALRRRIALAYRDRLNLPERAAPAFRDMLDLREDPEALAFLCAKARENERWSEWDHFLERMAKVETDSEKRRDLIIERASLLSERLDRPRDAIDLLRTLTASSDPPHVGALRALAALAAQMDDVPELADTLEQLLRIEEDPSERVSIARRLADLYEETRPELERTIAVLEAWAEADLTDPTPVRRLTGLLEQTERWKDLVIALDTLADLGEDEVEVRALTRQSAEIAHRHLGDVEGAWERLSSSTAAGDEKAEEKLRELAHTENLEERLAGFYVSLAEASAEPKTKQRRFVDAANAEEVLLGNPTAALEAMLRAFAVDLDDRKVRDEVDRLARAAKAWPRLAQVYETLVRRAETPRAKADLLLHHARLLDDPSAALDRVLRSCALVPGDDEILKRAEDLARQTDRAEELLVPYERRCATASTDRERIDALMRAVRVCAVDLEDEPRALSLLARAVSLLVQDVELAPSIEAAIRDIDEARTERLTRGLVDAYRALAERTEAAISAWLWRRAGARLLELGDEAAAWDTLIHGAAIAPDERSLEGLFELAVRMERLAQLDAHIEDWIRDALDSSTAAFLLRWRAQILEKIERWNDAADVYARLKVIAPHDDAARFALRVALGRAGRHQDLLLALDFEITKARADQDHERELALRKEAALTWERDLKNKWEALESWQKVRALSPEDAEANEAIRRISERPSRPVLDSESDEKAPERTQEHDTVSRAEPVETAQTHKENATAVPPSDISTRILEFDTLDEGSGEVLLGPDVQLEEPGEGGDSPDESVFEPSDEDFEEVLESAEMAAESRVSPPRTSTVPPPLPTRLTGSSQLPVGKTSIPPPLPPRDPSKPS